MSEQRIIEHWVCSRGLISLLTMAAAAVGVTAWGHHSVEKLAVIDADAHERSVQLCHQLESLRDSEKSLQAARARVANLSHSTPLSRVLAEFIDCLPVDAKIAQFRATRSAAEDVSLRANLRNVVAGELKRCAFSNHLRFSPLAESNLFPTETPPNLTPMQPLSADGLVAGPGALAVSAIISPSALSGAVPDSSVAAANQETAR